MRTLFAALFFTACGEDIPYSPDDQDFDAFDDYGSGIPGFNPNAGSGVDTNPGGNGDDTDHDGTYTGTFNITIDRLNQGDQCFCSAASVALFVQDGAIAAGSGQCMLSGCNILINLQVRGNVEGGGYATGTLEEIGSFTFVSDWDGMFLNGSGNGTFVNEGLDSTFGPINVQGNFIVNK